MIMGSAHRSVPTPILFLATVLVSFGCLSIVLSAWTMRGSHQREDFAVDVREWALHTALLLEKSHLLAPDFATRLQHQADDLGRLEQRAVGQNGQTHGSALIDPDITRLRMLIDAMQDQSAEGPKLVELLRELATWPSESLPSSIARQSLDMEQASRPMYFRLRQQLDALRRQPVQEPARPLGNLVIEQDRLEDVISLLDQWNADRSALEETLVRVAQDFHVQDVSSSLLRHPALTPLGVLCMVGGLLLVWLSHRIEVEDLDKRSPPSLWPATLPVERTPNDEALVQEPPLAAQRLDPPDPALNGEPASADLLMIRAVIEASIEELEMVREILLNGQIGLHKSTPAPLTAEKVDLMDRRVRDCVTAWANMQARLASR